MKTNYHITGQFMSMPDFKRVYLFVCLVLFFKLGLAQNPGFEMNYPSFYAEGAHSVAATSDGGYVMTGFQGINIGVANIAIRKVNAAGEEQWVQYLGNGGSNMGFSIIENAWGNIVVAGRTNETTPAPNHHEAYLAELDENGEMIWERIFPHADGTGFLSSISQANDLGYVVAGGQLNLIGESTDTDIFIARTDVVGDTIWTFKWGTTNLDLINDIFILQDGSILCAGVTDVDQGFQDMLLLKLTEDGELIWLNTYDIEGFDVARSIAVDSENNIILGGYSGFVDGEDYELPDICIVKIDSTGNLIWYKKYGGDKDDNVKDIILDEADNIFAVGNSASYKPPGSPGGYAGFLTKLNTEGDSVWTRVYYNGISKNFHSITSAPGDGFAIVGSSNSGMILIRTDEWGCIEEGCELETSLDETEDDLQFSVWPNPASADFQLTTKQDVQNDHRLVLYSSNGQVIRKWENPLKNSGSKKFDISTCTSGIYFLQLVIESSEGSGKVFKLIIE